MHITVLDIGLEFGAIVPLTQSVTKTVTVRGAVAGGFCQIAYPASFPAGITLKATCTASNTIEVVAINSLALTVTIPALTFAIEIRQ